MKNFDLKWHLQYAYATWISWGYNCEESKDNPNWLKIHINPACSMMGKKDFKFRYTFNVDEISPIEISDGKFIKPTMGEKRNCWGWRFFDSSTLHDCGWNLCDKEEDIIPAAKKWIQNQKEIFGHNCDNFLDFLTDMRDCSHVFVTEEN